MEEEIKQAKQLQAKLLTDSRAIIELAKTEKRDITVDEKTKYDKIMADFDDSIRTSEIKEKQFAVETRMKEAVNEPPKAEISIDPSKRNATKEYDEEFRNFLATGKVEGKFLRALQADLPEAGGYTVASEKMSNMLIKEIDDQTFIRDASTIHKLTKAQSLGIVSLDADPEDGTWTAEIRQIDEDTQMIFGKRALNPGMLAKRIKLSYKLIDNSAIAIERLVAQRLGYKFAITEEKNFLTGNGAEQPLGLFTASAQGISTARDISTDNTTTEITFNGLKEAQYGVKAGYEAKGKWLFHRDAIKQLSKLVDGAGRYIWQPSTQVGQPAMLLGRPFMMSEYVPNTFTTGLYVGMFGDFKYYHIAESSVFTIQVLNELYAETSQRGYIGRQMLDGMPVLESAFSRITLA